MKREIKFRGKRLDIGEYLAYDYPMQHSTYEAAAEAGVQAAAKYLKENRIKQNRHEQN